MTAAGSTSETGGPGAQAPAPSWAQRRALRTVAGMGKRLGVGRLTVRLPDGRWQTFGDPGARLTADLDVHDWGFFTRLVSGGSVGAGESYMAGDWSSSDLVSLVRLVVANRDHLGSLTLGNLARIAGDQIIHLARANRPGQARDNIAAHYDLSNDLYELFLDETMTYSCAVFETPGQSLTDAQRNKYRRLADKARLDPDDHVLEIGCGWGGFAIVAAGEYGCRVTGVTLSEEQADYAEKQIAAAGLSDPIDIQLADYRQLEGSFDKIVSIEMLEAVGHRYLGTYFAAVDRLLAHDGLVALQVITMPEQRYAGYRLRPDFIQRYIFPGGHVPSLEAMCSAMGSDSQLYVQDVDNIGIHYAETLRRWRTRFLERSDEVRALGFDDQFVRMWEFYLAYCEGAFLDRYLGDLQLVLTRTHNATLGPGPYGDEPPVQLSEADLGPP